MLHERFVARWGKTRQKGRGRFIFVYGVLGWGVPFGILMSLVAIFGFESHPDPVLTFFGTMILALIGGLIFGAVMWWQTEWKYEEAVLLLEAAGKRPPRQTQPIELEHSEAIQRLDRRQPL